jgi:hypothetical protein
VTAEVDAASTRWAGFGPPLEILALWALAGAQPVLELFGKNAEFFLAADTGPGEIVAFVAIVAFAVPLALIVVEAVIRLVRPSVGPSAHRVILAVLGFALGLNVARQLDFEALVVAVAFGVGFAVLVLWLERRETARTALRYLGLAPLAFALLFVYQSEAGSLIFSDDAEVIEVQGGGGGPVALVVFDELPLASLLTRDGDINARRFPNFARLADMSTWYRNGTSVNPSTPESVPSIMTGQLPEAGVLPTSHDQPINIFTLLGSEYEVDAFEGVTDLCPDVVCEPAIQHVSVDSFLSDVWGAVGDAGVVYGHLTLPDGLRDDLPTLGQSWAGFLDTPDETVDAPPSPEALVATEPLDDRDDLVDFLSGRAEEARGRGGQGRDLVPLIEGYSALDGTLLVGHDPFLPHRPWHLTPSGVSYDGGVGGVTPGEGRWPDSPTYVRRVLQRHLLQVGWADTLLGRLLDRFEDAGTLDDATIAVVADHGISFAVGGPPREPTEDNVEEIYRVPMLIKAPGQEPGDGEVSDRNALLVDVVPTLLDLLGVDPPANADFDGQSLVSASFERDDGDKPVVHHSGPEVVPGDFTDVLPVALRNAAYVGDGGWVDLVKVGDFGRLVDHDVSSMVIRPPLQVDWQVAQDDELADIDDSAALPLAVSGHLATEDLDVDIPDQLLVVLDGEIVGVADLDAESGDFAGLLDERRLTAGEHDLDLYLPVGGRQIRHLVPT